MYTKLEPAVVATSVMLAGVVVTTAVPPVERGTVVALSEGSGVGVTSSVHVVELAFSEIDGSVGELVVGVTGGGPYTKENEVALLEGDGENEGSGLEGSIPVPEGGARVLAFAEIDGVAEGSGVNVGGGP